VRHTAAVDIEAKAIYGEVTYDFTEATQLTLRLRYNDENHGLHSDNRQEIFVKNGTGGINTIVRSAAANCAASPDCDGLDTDFRETTWRIVLNHHFNDDLLGYVSYNRGFKSGAYVLSTANEWRPTEPEILDAYEIGYKGYAFDRTLQFTGAFYYYDYTDLQQALTDPQTATARVINAASATSTGAELDLTWSATDNLTVQAGVSKTFKAEYDEFPNCEVYTQNPAGGATVIKADCSGTDQIVSPDYTVYLAANYAYPFANGSRLTLGGVLDYTDGYQYLPEPKADLPIMQPRQDGMETLNMHVQWTAPADAYFVKFWGNNLTNSDRLMGLSATAFGINGQYDRGRTYGATLGIKF
jgi:iron complex outermembrane receptor protein